MDGTSPAGGGEPDIPRRRSAAEFSTARLEAFSDGVFAIAITLLVLDLDVPDPGGLRGESLARALAHRVRTRLGAGSATAPDRPE